MLRGSLCCQCQNRAPIDGPEATPGGLQIKRPAQDKAPGIALKSLLQASLLPFWAWEQWRIFDSNSGSRSDKRINRVTKLKKMFPILSAWEIYWIPPMTGYFTVS